MRKRGIVSAVVAAALVGASGVAVLAHGRERPDRWVLAAGGHRPTPLATIRLADGRYELRAYLDQDAVPNIVHFTPGQGGGVRLVAVGERGGWAIEPRVMRAGDRDIVYGATIGDAAHVRVRTPEHETTAATISLPGHQPFRYFVALTEPGSHVQRSHDVEAYDEHGRLLGRAHDNHGTASAPDFGAYDGRWDREHEPPPLD